uniref:Uncharacterized protein n=1 Tax=Opuntia streptacantha TaxID=393608 RepID=A0A7C9APM2_OPUST
MACRYEAIRKSPRYLRKKLMISRYLPSVIESSAHIVSHRMREVIFLRIPRKTFGGLGKSGGKKSVKSKGCEPSNLERDLSKTVSVTSAKEFFKSFPPKRMKSFKIFCKFQLLGCL